MVGWMSEDEEEGKGKGWPSMSCPTMTDKLATTVVKSMEDMSSMQPSESIISTGLLSFSFSFSLSFQLPPVTPSILSFTTSMYRDRMDAEVEIPSPCPLNIAAYVHAG